MPTLSFAGHPSEDPQVNALRTQFANAAIPTTSDFEHKAQFNCVERIAVRGDFTVNDRPSFINVYDSGVPGYFSNVGTAKPTLFKATDGGMVGAYEDYIGGVTKNYRMVLRLGQQLGEIIGEWSVQSADSMLKRTFDSMAPAIGADGFSAMSYFYCQKLGN